MQHYGAPTRILDWTWSPYVALYFAVCEFPTADGCLWMCEPANFSDRVREQRPELTTQEGLRFPFVDAQRPVLVFQEPWRRTARMAAQDAVYSAATSPLSDHRELVEDMLSGHRHRGWAHRIVVPAAIKRDVASRLVRSMASARALFPGPDGLGRDVYDNYILDEPIWTERDLPGAKVYWRPDPP